MLLLADVGVIVLAAVTRTAALILAQHAKNEVIVTTS